MTQCIRSPGDEDGTGQPKSPIGHFNHWYSFEFESTIESKLDPLTDLRIIRTARPKGIG